MSDIALALAGIPLGIAESAKDALLLPAHLPEMIKGKAIYFVAETAAIIDNAVNINSDQATRDFEMLKQSKKFRV